MGGGGDRWLAEVIPRLRKREYDITLLTTSFIPKGYRATPTRAHVQRIVNSGAIYAELGCSPLSFVFNHPLHSATSLKELGDAIARHDVVYFLNAYAFQDILFWLVQSLAPPTPVISAQHASLFQDDFLHDTYVRTATRCVLCHFDACHVLNQEDFEIYTQWGLDRTFLIPNGVDTQWFSPSKSEPSEEFRVLYVGRLTYQKGIDTLLESIELVNKAAASHSNLHFEICGTGPLRNKVQRFAQETENVAYLGFVSESDLLHRYRNASAFVMPSRRETFGLVAMEAMSCGLPVITSDIPGPRTFVDNEYGRLVPPGHPKLLANAMRDFYTLWTEKNNTYREMRCAARSICVERYDWCSIVDRLAAMIREVIDTTRR